MVEAQALPQETEEGNAEQVREDRLVSYMFRMPNEADDVLLRFMRELEKPTGDGQQKRRSGKPPWYVDTDHEAAIFSHLMKWKRGETVDPDSGAHPLVHAAWRCLAIACKETGNVPKVLTDEQRLLH